MKLKEAPPVLRCYDHRFPNTINRSPVVYLSTACEGIVGIVEKRPVVKLTGTNADANSKSIKANLKNTNAHFDAFEENFWSKSSIRSFEVPVGGEESDNFPPTDEEFWFNPKDHNLLIIAVPYRHGSHVAKKPKDFVPIINQVRELHKAGFVHGDIRAFNTVFGRK
eukprot:scaffold19006_cov75-Cylindrotheca_fusiformis.AAC.1